MRTIRLDVVVATAILSLVSATSFTVTAQSPQQTPPPQAPPPQAPSPVPPQSTFRSSTNLVEVDVVVQDSAGRFVPGLTIDDLAVLAEREQS